MRRTPASRLLLWVRHAYRPSVAATVFGGLFGVALLRMQPEEFTPEPVYSEPALRAAVFEPSSVPPPLPAASADFRTSFTSTLTEEDTAPPLVFENELIEPVVTSQ